MASEWEAFKYSLSRRHSNPVLLSQVIKSDKTLPHFIRLFTVRILKEVSARGSLDRYNPLSLFNVPYEISVKFADTYIDDPEVVNDYIEWFKLTHNDVKYYDKLEDRYRKVEALSRLPYWAFWSILSRRALVEELILKNNALHGVTWDNLTLIDEHALEIMIGNAAATPDPHEWIVGTFNDVSWQYREIVSDVLSEMNHGQQMQLLRCLQGPFIWQWLGRGGSIHEFDTMPRQVLLRAPPYAILRNSGRTYHKTSSSILRSNNRYGRGGSGNNNKEGGVSSIKRKRPTRDNSNGLYDCGSVLSNSQHNNNINNRYNSKMEKSGNAAKDLKNYRNYTNNERNGAVGNNRRSGGGGADGHGNNPMSHDIISRRRSRRRVNEQPQQQRTKNDDNDYDSSNSRGQSPNEKRRRNRGGGGSSVNWMNPNKNIDTIYSIRSTSIRRRRRPSPNGRTHSPAPRGGGDHHNRKRRSRTPVRIRHKRSQNLVNEDDSACDDDIFSPQEVDENTDFHMESVYPVEDENDDTSNTSEGEICVYPCCAMPVMPTTDERSDLPFGGLNVSPELGETWFLSTCKTNTGLGTAVMGVIHKKMSS